MRGSPAGRDRPTARFSPAHAHATKRSVQVVHHMYVRVEKSKFWLRSGQQHDVPKVPTPSSGQKQHAVPENGLPNASQLHAEISLSRRVCETVKWSLRNRNETQSER